MRGAFFALIATAALCGCSGARGRQSPAALPLAPAPSAPVEKGETFQKVGSSDVSLYEIPRYPETKLVAEMSQVDPKTNRVVIQLESYQPIPDITKWYRDQIKATQGQSSINLGAVAGTTHSGYPIDVTIADVNGKSIIKISVDANRKK
jgi:hypothetical protein